MVPFVVLVALFGLCEFTRRVWATHADAWTSLRLALAGMFLLTASAHWGRRRVDLVRVVPPAFPAPEFLVTVTGLMELAGAVGLMFATTAPYAAIALVALLVAVFPANVHAAREGLSIGGRRVVGLLPRALLQLVFIGSGLWVYFGAGR
jgi:uncharacterized membrane protein